MASILNQEDIIRSAFDIVRAEGPDRLTARVLASSLFVAPATLYNYVDSMDAVTSLVEDQVLTTMLEDLSGAHIQSMTALLAWFRENPNLAHLLLDPTRVHERVNRERLKTVFREMSDWVDPSAIEDIRGFLALANALLEPEDIAAADVWRNRVADAFVQTTSQPAPELSQLPDPTGRIIELISQDKADDETRRQVRSATATIIGRGEPWSFQGMATETGLSVGKLHRLGNRRQHLAAYSRDWTNGAADIARTAFPSPVEALPQMSALFVRGGLSTTALSDVWHAQPAQAAEAWLALAADAATEANPTNALSPRVVVSAQVGITVARIAQSTSSAERIAAGDMTGALALALINT